MAAITWVYSSGTPIINHCTQVALTTTALSQQFIIDPRKWLSVMAFSPSAWSFQGTYSSGTDSFPVQAGQVLTLQFQGPTVTYGLLGTASQTLYLVPLTWGNHNP